MCSSLVKKLLKENNFCRSGFLAGYAKVRLCAKKKFSAVKEVLKKYKENATKTSMWLLYTIQNTRIRTIFKEIEITHRLFLVIAMYCQASSSQFNESLNLPHC